MSHGLTNIQMWEHKYEYCNLFQMTNKLTKLTTNSEDYANYFKFVSRVTIVDPLVLVIHGYLNI